MTERQQQDDNHDAGQPPASEDAGLRKTSSSSLSSLSRASSSISPQTTRRSPIIKPQSLSATAIASTSIPTPLQTPRREASLTPVSTVSKRSSFIGDQNYRGYPGSPRAQRTLSLSGAAWTDLLMNPTTRSEADDAKFKGRDWRAISVHEIIDQNETRFVELDTSIENTTKTLIRSGAPNVVLVRESTKTRTAIDTFDYSDLNTYLLLVLGMLDLGEAATQLAQRAREGTTLPLSQVLDLLRSREPPAFLPHTATLLDAMEILGSGHHRLIVTKEGGTEALGVLSQLRLVRFFWENHQSFTATEQLYSLSLKDLGIGAKEVLAVNGDKPLADALLRMHNEGITSLPVLDSGRNVVGNISHVDTRLLTDTSAIPLLSSTCIHFVSVILSERGLVDGKDAYPVFYVNPFSTLAHTVAKLCATRSHRMWIVDSPSPSNSIPPSPGPHHAQHSLSMQNNHQPQVPYHSTPATVPVRTAAAATASTDATPGPPYTSTHPGTSVPAGALPGANMSGRLSGVVSLTDVLNLLARASGLRPLDPEETRRRRRQSSSGSNVRNSIDGARPSGEFLRDIARSSSTSSNRRAPR